MIRDNRNGEWSERASFYHYTCGSKSWAPFPWLPRPERHVWDFYRMYNDAGVCCASLSLPRSVFFLCFRSAALDFRRTIWNRVQVQTEQKLSSRCIDVHSQYGGFVMRFRVRNDMSYEICCERPTLGLTRLGIWWRVDQTFDFVPFLAVSLKDFSPQNDVLSAKHKRFPR